ncbi:hypothetical protein [Haloarchaeobius sp. HME9146]|uniref:hypothetical protein n=1 Tax=Haloarchaeobius sp. HME9146 TaxID=2978732 RepID=UPI0021C0871E|nr:hypothetical protein [Haloarchaeobius sp. HME9146]MCT9095729.1 hypothetical protein [Haloarchaeobius sp. HME9146]
MRARVGRVILRLALVMAVGFWGFLGLVYLIGFSVADSYGPPTFPHHRFYHRLDIGLHVLASKSWLPLLFLGVCLLGVGYVSYRRNVLLPNYDLVVGSRQLTTLPGINVTKVTERIPNWLSRASRAFATALGFSWLAVLLVVVVALLLGPAPIAQDTHTVSADDPAAELAADAIADIQTRRHTTEVWIHKSEPSEEFERQGIWYRVVKSTPDGSTGRVELWPGILRENTTPADPGYAYYADVPFYWTRGADGDWRRVEYSTSVQVAEIFQDDVGSVRPAVLREANASMTAKNSSMVTVRYTDPAIIEGFSLEVGENDSGYVLLSIAIDEKPHLQRVEVQVSSNQFVSRRVFRVSEVDTATVETPDHVPATTERLVWRAEHGLDRMASWVGL